MYVILRNVVCLKRDGLCVVDVLNWKELKGWLLYSMTRFSDKLRLRSFSLKPTRFLSLLSLSTLYNLCKSLARFFLSQTLPFFPMDNLFPDLAADHFDSSSSSSSSYRPLRRFLDDDDRDSSLERVYLIPHR